MNICNQLAYNSNLTKLNSKISKQFLHVNFKSSFVKQNTKNEVKNLNFRSSFFRNMYFERTGRRWPYKSMAREACGKLVKLSYKFKSNEAQVATVKINFKKNR